MFQTVNYEIYSQQLEKGFDGYRIVHLSDLHGAVFGSKNKDLIKKIHEIRPHMVAMTGDMADHSDYAMTVAAGLCGRLARRYPVYYVPGNHEQCLKGEQWRILAGRLKDLGVTVLENKWCTVSFKGAYLKVYGLVTPMKYYKDPLRKDYEKNTCFTARDAERLLGKADSFCYKLLLAHNPLYYPAYRDWGADLTLSGHIHGGIIRVPGMGGLLSPDVTFFPKYDGGHFRENGKDLVVSRGLGNHFLARVRNPEELVVITLRRA